MWQWLGAIFFHVLVVLGLATDPSLPSFPPITSDAIAVQYSTPTPEQVTPLASVQTQSRATSSLPSTTNEQANVPPLPAGSDWLTVLPLGDGKYTTSGPKKGYIYLCNVAQGGGGAQADGPWITGSTWNPGQKINVQGSVSWPEAFFHESAAGTTRTIASNGLPVDGTTGIFPVQASDPAAQYDRNPNSISAQNFDYSLPSNPATVAKPSCIYGEVGIMTNGVPLLDGFDAEYRDANAHEIQDACDGHPHSGGEYHYHGLSPCIPTPTITSVIGWAFDGFPITGPKLPNGKYVLSKDLDECHGMTSAVVIDGKSVVTYHYVMTQDFPYSVSCFKGVSHEPKPGPQGGGQQTGPTNTQGGQGMPPQGPGGGGMPPQQAIDACSGGSDGSTCSFPIPSGTMNGICRTPPGQSQLACVPH